MIFALTAALAVPVQANDYYVDFASGSNSNSGVSRAQAWKHAPGDPNATGAAAAAALNPGDTVFFKGGVNYNGQIRINASGAASGPITFKGDGWGPGKAIVDGSNSRAYGFRATSRSYIVIDGFVIRRMDKAVSSHGVMFVGGVSKISPLS